MTRASPLEGRRIYLRALLPADYADLYRLEVGTGGGWRFRGMTPSPERFQQSLHEGVLATFVVSLRGRQEVAGVVSAYAADLRNGHSFVATIAHPNAPKSIAIEGTALMVDHLFASFPLRKLYFETIAVDGAWMQRGMEHFLEEEGRLREFEFIQGRYWDKIYYSLSRASWESLRGFVVEDGDRTRRSEDVVGQPRGCDWAEFRSHLIASCGVDVGPEDVGDSLAEVGFDSLTTFAAIVYLEDLSGREVPVEVLPHVVDLSDLHNLYATYLSGRGLDDDHR